jgi:hypothetical protein
VRAAERRPGHAEFDLEAPALDLTVQEAPRTGVDASHFGIQVASSEDAAAARARFKAAGLETTTEENTSCCYAPQDKAWVEGPDGDACEVFVVKGEAGVMSAGPVLEPKAEGAACCGSKDEAVPGPKAAGCCGWPARAFAALSADAALGARRVNGRGDASSSSRSSRRSTRRPTTGRWC